MQRMGVGEEKFLRKRRTERKIKVQGLENLRRPLSISYAIEDLRVSYACTGIEKGPTSYPYFCPILSLSATPPGCPILNLAS
jgi:hypothetical protein